MSNWTIELEGTVLSVGGVDQLRDALDRVRSESRTSLRLTRDSGDGLFVILKGPLAYVEFWPSDEAPFKVASLVPQSLISRLESIEFDVGGTPTPVLKDLCLPFETMVRIAVEYMQSGRLPEFVNWIPLDWP